MTRRDLPNAVRDYFQHEDEGRARAQGTWVVSFASWLRSLFFLAPLVSMPTLSGP